MQIGCLSRCSVFKPAGWIIRSDQGFSTNSLSRPPRPCPQPLLVIHHETRDNTDHMSETGSKIKCKGMERPMDLAHSYSKSSGHTNRSDSCLGATSTPHHRRVCFWASPPPRCRYRGIGARERTPAASRLGQTSPSRCSQSNHLQQGRVWGVLRHAAGL